MDIVILICIGAILWKIADEIKDLKKDVKNLKDGRTWYISQGEGVWMDSKGEEKTDG